MPNSYDPEYAWFLVSVIMVGVIVMVLVGSLLYSNWAVYHKERPH